MASARSRIHPAARRVRPRLAPVALASVLLPPATAFAEVHPLVLPTVDGKPPNAGYSVGPLSAHGRYMVFRSSSTNLVSDDTVRCGIRSCEDIFVLDRDADGNGVFDESGATAVTLVSRASSGEPANEDSYAPSISNDGRYLAFTSYATNLTPGDSSLSLDVFVHDRETGRTEIASVSSTGAKADTGTDYYSAIISGNGRIVVFRSNASNLVPGDTNGSCNAPNGCVDLFAHDRVTGRTTRVSVSSDGAQANAASYYPTVSDDGRFVVFSSDASTLVEGDTNGVQDVFVHDLDTGITERVSLTSEGTQGDAPSFGQPRPAVSGDGRLVVFASSATNLPRGAMHNRATRQTLPACVDPAGATEVCTTPTLSLDSRRLVFTTATQGLVIARDLRRGRSIAIGRGYGPSISGSGRFVVYDSPETSSMIADLDEDADGLWNDFEKAYGLDPNDATGANGSNGDPDGDGRSNAQEEQDGTHPRGVVKRYLAEGATSDFFQTRLAFLNPTDTPAHVWLQFQKGSGSTQTQSRVVSPRSRATLDVGRVAGMASAEFSAAIESDENLVVDRTMRWDAHGYGTHAESAVAAPALTWYLAEGATHSHFNLFYLLQNPNASDAKVRVRYLRPSGAPLEKTYTLGANSRTNIWVNLEEFPGLGPVLSSTEVSAVFEVLNGQPIIVERAMYLDVPGQTFGAGHESAGVTAPATQWFLAEGATGPFFDLFVLVANPGTTDAQVEATYLLPNGPGFVKTYTVAANSRFNIWVDLEDPRLADTAVSTTIRSTNGVPVIVERAMWWPGNLGTWREAHNSPGATATGTTWALAEGEVSGDPSEIQTDTFILVANTVTSSRWVKVTLLFEDGTFAERVFFVGGMSRLNVWVRAEFPESLDKRFGALVESLEGDGPAQIVVERAVYSDALEPDVEQPGNFRRLPWAAGTNALATKLQ